MKELTKLIVVSLLGIFLTAIAIPSLAFGLLPIVFGCIGGLVVLLVYTIRNDNEQRRFEKTRGVQA